MMKEGPGYVGAGTALPGYLSQPHVRVALLLTILQ